MAPEYKVVLVLKANTVMNCQLSEPVQNMYLHALGDLDTKSNNKPAKCTWTLIREGSRSVAALQRGAFDWKSS